MHRFAAIGMALLFASACAGRRADFGTLPEVSIPIEAKPAQDPTLFPEESNEVPLAERGDPPDPTPLRLPDQFDYSLGYERGVVSVLSTRAVRLSQPASTERRMGRFAFELWAGEELIDRVRFDFPLLAASSADEDDPLGRGLSSKTSIRVPAASRATMARILDRKTREEILLPWPPQTTDSSTGPLSETENTPEPGTRPATDTRTSLENGRN